MRRSAISFPNFTVISDIHLHEWSYGAYPTKRGMNSRLVEQKNMLMGLRSFLENNECKNLVVCGDLFHTNNKLTAQAVEAAREVFSHLSEYSEIYIVPGNHDFASSDGSVNSIDWLSMNPRIKIVDGYFDLGGARAYAHKYSTDRDELLRCLDGVDKSNQETLVFLHQGVRGEEIGNGFVLENEILGAPDFDSPSISALFTGHYHVPKTLSGLPHRYIVGSPMHHTWSDAITDTFHTDKRILVANENSIESKRVKGPSWFLKLTNVDSVPEIKSSMVRAILPISEQPREDEIRKELRDKGARTVEFQYESKEKAAISEKLDSIEEIVDALVENPKLSKEMRSEDYEVTKYLD